MTVIDVWSNAIRQAINIATGLEFRQILRNRQNVLLEPSKTYAVVPTPSFLSQNSGSFKNLKHTDYTLTYRLSFYGANAQEKADAAAKAFQDRSNLEMRQLLYRYHLGYNKASASDAKLFKAGIHTLPVVSLELEFSATSLSPLSTFSDHPHTFFTIG